MPYDLQSIEVRKLSYQRKSHFPDFFRGTCGLDKELSNAMTAILVDKSKTKIAALAVLFYLYTQLLMY